MAEPVVPDRMEKHFEAAMSAKLLTVQTIEHMGTGWLVARLLAQWLLLCDDTVADLANARINTDRFRIGAEDDGVDPDTKSELGVAIFSLKHDFDHFASAVAPFGIDLKDLESRGHVRVFSNMYTRIFGDKDSEPPVPPSLTLMSALRLLMYEADKLKFTHKRAILLLDEPEFVTPVFEGDDFRMEKWVCMVQGASYVSRSHRSMLAKPPGARQQQLTEPSSNSTMPSSRLLCGCPTSGTRTPTAFPPPWPRSMVSTT